MEIEQWFEGETIFHESNKEQHNREETPKVNTQGLHGKQRRSFPADEQESPEHG